MQLPRCFAIYCCAVFLFCFLWTCELLYTHETYCRISHRGLRSMFIRDWNYLEAIWKLCDCRHQTELIHPTVPWISLSLWKWKKRSEFDDTRDSPKFFSHLRGTIWLISCLFETSRVECAQHRVGRSVNPSGHVVQPVLSVNNKTKRTPQGAQSSLPPSFQTRNMYPHKVACIQ